MILSMGYENLPKKAGGAVSSKAACPHPSILRYRKGYNMHIYLIATNIYISVKIMAQCPQ